jgi:hypothetical protein
MDDAQPHWYAPVLAAGVRAAASPQGVKPMHRQAFSVRAPWQRRWVWNLFSSQAGEPSGEPSSPGSRLHRTDQSVRFPRFNRHEATVSHVGRHWGSRSHRGGRRLNPPQLHWVLARQSGCLISSLGVGASSRGGRRASHAGACRPRQFAALGRGANASPVHTPCRRGVY